MELAACSFSCSYTYHYCSLPRARAGIRAAAHQGGGGGGGGEGAPPQRTAGHLAADGPPVVNVPVVAAAADGFGARDAELAMWEKLGAVVRLSYGIGIYAGMALAGRAICDLAGIDASGVNLELDLRPNPFPRLSS